MTAANTTIQMNTDPAVRGRVMALYMMVFLGATPIGSPVVGWIGEQYGPRWSVGIGSITAMLVAVGAAIWASRHWNAVVRYHVHRPHLEVRYPPVGDGARMPDEEAVERENAARILGAQEAANNATAA
jgi:MFS family permease